MAERAGKYIIIGIFAVGFLAAGSAWWYRYSQTRQAAQFWGGAAAETILKAGHVELIVLDKTPCNSNLNSLEMIVDKGSGPLHVCRRYDLTKTRGMLNARNALVNDRSLDFTVSQSATPTWQYGLRFHDDNSNILVLLDLKAGLAKAHGRPDLVGISSISDGFEILFSEAMNASPAATRP